MEKKVKLIIISLAGILVITVFFALVITVQRVIVARERNALKNTNQALGKRVEEALREKRQLEEKLEALSQELDRISEEKKFLEKAKEGIQREYGAAVKERDMLIERLKTAKVSPARGEDKPSAREEAYWAGVLQSKTDLSLEVEKLLGKLKTLQLENEQLRQELEGVAQEKGELEQQFSYNRKTFENISSQLVIEKNARLQLQNELKPIKSENALLRRQLKSLSKRRIKLENQLQDLRRDKMNLERRINEIELFLEDRFAGREEGAKEGLEPAVLESPSAQIELPPIVVRSPMESAPPISARPLAKESGRSPYAWGSILAINKENNFVVIDLGEDAGLKLGDTFKVYREGKAIANLEVIQLRKNIAACDIKEEKTPIAVGDSIR